jgi:predicted dehydrogenase
MAARPKASVRGSGAPLHLAIVGCGRVVERYHLPALARTPEWSPVAACDPLAERREWMAHQLDRIAVFGTLSELTGACHPDAALVATPPGAHCEAVVQALEAGMHVLVEKPMALSAADANRMWQTSLRTRRRLAVGFSRRFQRGHRELRERFALLASREVESIRFDLAGNAAAWKAVTGFLGDDRRGGGPLDDMAPHQLDCLLSLVRQHVTRVRARRAAVTEAHAERIEFTLEFESGLIAECSVGHGMRRQESLHLLLRDRQLVLDADRVFELRRRSAAWTRVDLRVRRLRERLAGRRPAAEDEVTPFARQLCSFARFCHSAGEGDGPSESRVSDAAGGDACSRGLEVIADGMSGLHAVRIVAACRESLRSGGSWSSVES